MGAKIPERGFGTLLVAKAYPLLKRIKEERGVRSLIRKVGTNQSEKVLSSFLHIKYLECPRSSKEKGKVIANSRKRKKKDKSNC